jgi:hypothetical protein
MISKKPTQNSTLAKPKMKKLKVNEFKSSKIVPIRIE